MGATGFGAVLETERLRNARGLLVLRAALTLAAPAQSRARER
jgi:hypothetical protein